MFDNLISSDSKKKQRAWTPLSVISSAVIIALVIAGAVYASTIQKSGKKKKKKKVVTYMNIQKVKPKPKPKPKSKPKPKPNPKPKPKPKKKLKGFQTLHTPTHISNKIPSVNLNAKKVNAANFSGMGVMGGTANGHGHGNGKKKGGVGTYGHGGFHTVFEAVGQMPKLKGGYAALQKHVQYPARCANAGIQGRVTVQFVVNKKGIPTKVHVTRGIGGGCDQAAVRAVKKYARFTPGRQRGKAVLVRMSLPIVFRLQH
jgi:TonB family protein